VTEEIITIIIYDNSSFIGLNASFYELLADFNLMAATFSAFQEKVALDRDYFAGQIMELTIQ